MAVIMKIRERFGIIVSIIIAFALLVFVLTSALQSNGSLFSGNKDVIGKINGTSLHHTILDDEVSHEEELTKIFQPDLKIDEEVTSQFRDQAWNKIVNDYITNDQYRKLALITGDDDVLSKEEIKDLFYSNDPAPAIKKNFSDPKTGYFDPNNVKNFVSGLNQQKDPKVRKQWDQIKEEVVRSAADVKYNNLVGKSFYIPKWLAELDYHDKNDKASIHFVGVPFSIIPDKDAPVSVDEMNKYIQEHKEKFKQEENSRAVNYVVFAVKPSHDDTMAAQSFMDKAHETFVSGDTDAIRKIAENPDDNHYYKKEELKSYKSDSIFKVKIGGIYGPYFEDGLYKLFKINDKREVPDSVKTAYIIIHPQKPADSLKAKKKADSIYSLIVAKKISFDTAAMKFSDDPNSKAKGGDLGWLKQIQIPATLKPLSDFLFLTAKKKDDMKVVKTENGYNIVKVEDIGLLNPCVKITFLTRKLEASSVTDKNIYNTANTFAAKNRNDSSFLKAAKAQKLNLVDLENVKPNDQQLSGGLQARDMVRWINSAKKGDVSEVITCGDKYVVALLTRINEIGTKTLEDPVVRRNVENEVRRIKKGNAIIAKYFAGPISTNLETYATALNTQVMEAKDIVAANPMIQNLGFEPKVLGAIFAGKTGQPLKPIIGDNGVFVIQIDERNIAPPVADYSQSRNQLTGMYASHIQRQQRELLKKLMAVEDLRFKVYNQN